MVCVHGAGSGPWVFDGWVADLPGWRIVAVDLQAGLDVGTASMGDYVAMVHRARTARRVLCGWSMGGLVAMMAAAEARPLATVLIEPSLPAELAGRRDVVPQQGTYDPDEVYGANPDGPPTRMESRFALEERRRGISVPHISPPLLVVAGATFASSPGGPVADYYGGDVMTFPRCTTSCWFAIGRYAGASRPGWVSTSRSTTKSNHF
jgi:pimeloyl-ACP methyl ester carboxylesterase